MSNYIIKIEPERTPVFTSVQTDLSAEHIRSLIGGESKKAAVWTDLENAVPGLVMLLNGNKDKADLESNTWATIVSRRTLETKFGTALLVICEDDIFRPLSEAEADALAEALTAWTNVEFSFESEEGDEE